MRARGWGVEVYTYQGHQIEVRRRRGHGYDFYEYPWVAKWHGHVRQRGVSASPRRARDDAEYAIAHNISDNPTLIDHANNIVGDFVNDHPWISALIGGTALGAAGYIGVLITQAVIRQTPSSSTITTSDTSTGPTSTSTSTPTSTSTSSGSTSTSSTSSSSSSTPTYDASKVVTLYIQNAGKEVPVGTSLTLLDASTGLVVNGSVEGSAGVLEAGPSVGTFLAVGPGTVKVYAPDGSSTTVVVKPASGTAGVAISPKRPMPKLRGLTSLLVGPSLASGG